MHTLLVCLLLFAVPAAWASKPIEVSRPSFHCVGASESAQLPKTLPALRALGELLTEDVVRTEEWDGYKAIEKHLRFKGMSLQVITFTNQPERYSLGSLELVSSAWSVAPIRVGQLSAPLLTQLGVREVASSGAWRFNGESDSLLIEVRQGKVHRVLYECHTG